GDQLDDPATVLDLLLALSGGASRQYGTS
ncbi:MAG: hypothetical protein QOJ49_271, partial [Actinomycetota bacterium]|nr:hypothetical protein [Actinomycetota bacterium]